MTFLLGFQRSAQHVAADSYLGARWECPRNKERYYRAKETREEGSGQQRNRVMMMTLFELLDVMGLNLK